MPVGESLPRSLLGKPCGPPPCRLLRDGPVISECYQFVLGFGDERDLGDIARAGFGASRKCEKKSHACECRSAFCHR